jgi:hypothetical protein
VPVAEHSTGVPTAAAGVHDRAGDRDGRGHRADYAHREAAPLRATIDTCGKRVILLRDGRPILGLVRVGEGEFRFAGWTDERTLHITP